MCQQWFSVAGLTLEVFGFLLIAWEWRHVEHSVVLRQAAVEEDYELTVNGDEAARQRRIAEASMAKYAARKLEGQSTQGVAVLFGRGAGGVWLRWSGRRKLAVWDVRLGI